MLTEVKSTLGVKDAHLADVAIQDGEAASHSLEALLLDADAYADADRRALRNALLRYCERDTLAMVRLHERLVGMADAAAERDGSGAMRPG